MTRIRCPHCNEIFEVVVGHVCGEGEAGAEAARPGWDRKEYMKAYMRDRRRRLKEEKR